ncbi:putative 5-dehydro-4-deoxyglucarate dehydratase [Marmoricola endophyticus]|uniref:Probable 5-dehydro-4-deoxyglucarate dehydratase n=1 Tax=Marmoricola endophyticus TaxID=2040280 RepID=A0A917F615_9ACTN|nr:5-dehydro-4-deoxyglucarate dehydratase [Marmoricola endophyticus]GGF54821.1 putative 5-dehydro-4-deoxyglucarate dehydratase [Marmoricola endophyticus]
MTSTHEEVAARLGSGLLSFPVTHFTATGELDLDAYAGHIDWLGGHDVAGLFAAGGTGEFFSLTPAEVGRVVRSAVEGAPEGLPVVAPVGYGTATAIELARDAEAAGATALLLFPPYLTEASQDGLFEHVRSVCSATSLPVIVYNRANARYAPETVERLVAVCPTLIGFKDGVGDVDQMTRIAARVGERLIYVGGLPTAEMYALPYTSLGLTTYSSAIFNFLPEFALDFYAAVRRGDTAYVLGALDSFVIPYCDLRNRANGYAVSIVKAGLTVIGRPAGPVRAPLSDLDADELAQLEVLVRKVQA